MAIDRDRPPPDAEVLARRIRHRGLMSFIFHSWQLLLVILAGRINRQQQLVTVKPRVENQGVTPRLDRNAVKRGTQILSNARVSDKYSVNALGLAFHAAGPRKEPANQLLRYRRSSSHLRD
jgi:hypothetical protein